MDINTFRESLSGDAPANECSPYLKALWYEAKGDWQKAHHLVQDIDTDEAAAIHAYLHRKEGDNDNARYWYARAGQPAYNGSLEKEWMHLVRELLAVS